MNSKYIQTIYIYKIYPNYLVLLLPPFYDFQIRKGLQKDWIKNIKMSKIVAHVHLHLKRLSTLIQITQSFTFARVKTVVSTIINNRRLD